MESKQVEAIAVFESELQTAVDPLPAATLGMYLFLASEAMFFVGLLGAFIVLMSTGEQHQLFAKSSAMLERGMALWSTGILLISSTFIIQKKRSIIVFALGAGLFFVFMTAAQWGLLLRHDRLGPQAQLPNYGPSRNNFFGCYFLITAVHCLHLIFGIITVLWYIIFRSGKLPHCVQIYWHFVNAAGAITFAALYYV